MPFFKKKPVLVEAYHYLPGVNFGAEIPLDQVYDALMAPDDGREAELNENSNTIQNWLRTNNADFECVNDPVDGPCILINTLEGQMKAVPDYWIIKGAQGEFYPCKPDKFAETYEAA